MDKLRIAQFRLTMTAREAITLPQFQGNVWRGGFGAIFRRVVCVQPHQESCRDCLMRGRCAYAYIFNTPVPPDAAVLRKNTSAPRPFVLEPSLTPSLSPGKGEGRKTPSPHRGEGRGEGKFAPGAELTVGLTLIGRAIEYLPYFIVVFQQLGEAGIGRDRGRYELTTVHAVQRWTGAEVLIYQDGAVRSDMLEELVIGAAEVQARMATLTPGPSPSEGEGDELPLPFGERVGVRGLTVNFLTPARLKYRGQYVGMYPDAPVEFHVLLRNLTRRVSAVYYFHCGDTWEADYGALVGRAQTVRITNDATQWWGRGRYSRRQERAIDLSGVVGRMTYAGDIAEFLPWLAIGELVHVGKGTVFGNGRYEIATEMVRGAGGIEAR